MEPRGSSRRLLNDKVLNVSQITEQMGNIMERDWHSDVCFRAADVLVKEARIYEQQGDTQAAYGLLYRHANLVLKEIPTLPKAKKGPDFDTRLKLAQAKALASLEKMEVLKPLINARYETHMKVQRYRAEKRNQQGNVQIPQRGSSKQLGGAEVAQLQARDHTEYAVQMANWATNQRVSRSRGGELNEEIALLGNRVSKRTTSSSTSAKGVVRSGPYAVNYSYPKVPTYTKTSRTTHAEDIHSRHLIESSQMPATQRAPLLPPKRPAPPPKQSLPPNLPPLLPKSQSQPSSQSHQSTRTYDTAPPRPSKVLVDTPPSPPSYDSDEKSSQNQFAPSAFLENDTPLRTIFLPSPLKDSFLELASANTTRNLETLGLLCGHLLQNAFFITTLLIPKQSSTSDTCEMLDEEGMYAYIDSHSPEGSDLLVLGWIHTHPSQTCFLSSRDLHTHVWYQVSLPESIAVVCAPSKPHPLDYGVFRLTDPPGMPTIKSCKQDGVFHPHDGVEGELYVHCSGRPGHVVEHEQLKFEVVDLR